MTPVAQSKFLRPRQADRNDPTSFPDLLPDPTTGKITYNVNNDGDGLTDSVWVNLGYPARRDSRGQLVKPMFAFMVVGLNGRIPLNTAGNLAMRNRAGNCLFMHTSHLGNSPSEVDPTFALQNATNYYPNEGTSGLVSDRQRGHPGPGDDRPRRAWQPGVHTWRHKRHTPNPGDALLRHRGFRQRHPASEYSYRHAPPLSRFVDPSLLAPLYGDANWVLVNGQRWYMPNNMPDIADEQAPGSTIINLPPTTVAGRWGEPGGITAFFDTSVNPLLGFLNPVRAGKSVLSTLATGVQYSLNDGRDDNFNATDFWPQPMYAETGGVSSPIARTGPHSPGRRTTTTPPVTLPCPSSTRRFVTPVNAAGDGELVNWTTRANTGTDPSAASPTEGTSVPRASPSRPLASPTPARGWSTPRARPPCPTSRTIEPTDMSGSATRTSPVPMCLSSTTVPPPRTWTITATRRYHREWGVRAVSRRDPTIPTFNQFVNTYFSINPATGLYDPTANLNEANEMNLYAPGGGFPLDQSFGHGDLEWLYRGQNVDADALQSRLADLAPISSRTPPTA